MSNKFKSWYLNQTVIITAISGYAYFLWFQYERGICDYYQIPDYFIAPSISEFLLCLTALLTILFSAFKSISALTPFLKTLQNPLKQAWHRIIFINIYYLILGLILIKAKAPTWNEILYFVLPAVLFNIIFFFGFWLFRRRNRPTEERINLTLDAMQGGNNLLDLFKFRFTLPQIYLLIIILSLPIFVFFLGSRKAQGEEEFWVIESSKYVVIKRYDNKLFCREYDSSFVLNQNLKIYDSNINGLTLIKKKLSIKMKY